MAIYITGLKEVKMGDVAADGGPSGSLEVVGDIYEGGITLETDDPTVTTFKNEDGTIIASEEELGDSTVAFQVSNLDADTAENFLGATANTNGGWDLLKFPSGIEKTLAFTSRTGNMVLTYARTRIVAKLTGGLNKESPLLLSVTGTILQPTKASTPVLSVTKGA